MTMRVQGMFRGRAWRRAARVMALVVLCVTLAMADNEKRFHDLGNKMMCQCGCGQILLQCNHVGCSVSTKLSGELREMLAQGKTDDQVLAAFAEKYGPVVLAAPTKTGFNRVAWIVPYATLGFGLVLVGGLVRAWNKRRKPQGEEQAAAAAAAGGDPEGEALRARVREETEL